MNESEYLKKALEGKYIRIGTATITIDRLSRCM